jgi:hypothetical protein
VRHHRLTVSKIAAKQYSTMIFITSPTPSHSIIPIKRYKNSDKKLQIDVFILYAIPNKRTKKRTKM